MRQAVLHIGMHKTGSTAIQQAFNGRSSSEARYARLSHANHSIPLATVFKQGPYHHWNKFDLSDAEISSRRHDFLADLESEFNSDVHQHLIFSGEDLGLLKDQEKAELISVFRSHGVDVRVICFVRDPVAFVSSALQQRIKHGLKDVGEISPWYRQRLTYFAQILDPEKLVVMDYGRLCAEHGDIVCAFQNVIGFRFENLASVRPNKSSSLDATRLILCLNRLCDPARLSVQGKRARSRLVVGLHRIFPEICDKPKQDWEPVSGLLSADIEQEVAFLKFRFGISYEVPSRLRSLEAVEIFLSEIGHIDTSRLREGLEDELRLKLADGSCRQILASALEKIIEREIQADSVSTYTGT